MRRGDAAFTSLTGRGVSATAPITMDLFEFREIVCPTCGVDDTFVLGVRGGASHRTRAGVACTVVECRRCGLIYANPFPFPRDLDALYSNSEGYFDAHDVTSDAMYDIVLAKTEEMVTGRRLLDVGAGLGLAPVLR